MVQALCFNSTDQNLTRTFDSGRFRKRKARRKGGMLLRYFEDRMTGHLYAVVEGVKHERRR